MTYNELKDYALVVGIDHYPDYGSNGRNLNGAVRDAKLFAEWLMDTTTGGGLPAANCEIITSTEDSNRLTADTIDGAFARLWQAAKNANGGRRLYMFFSGHGQVVDGPNYSILEQSLCLPAWSFMRPNCAVSTDNLSEIAIKCMPFEEVAVFLDCCRVSTIRVKALPTSVGCPLFQDGHHEIKKQVFYAAEPLKKAYEDGDEGAVHGHFTKALIQGLKTGTNRNGGGISAKDLWGHLKYWVKKNADDANHNQKPVTNPPTPYEDMVFGRAKPIDISTNFEIRFHDWRDSHIQLLDPETNIVREGRSSDGPWMVQLHTGMHMLLDKQTEEMLSFVFRSEMEGKYVTF